jgi:hypothetical protein
MIKKYKKNYLKQKKSKFYKTIMEPQLRAHPYNIGITCFHNHNDVELIITWKTDFSLINYSFVLINGISIYFS